MYVVLQVSFHLAFSSCLPDDWHCQPVEPEELQREIDVKGHSRLYCYVKVYVVMTKLWAVVAVRLVQPGKFSREKRSARELRSRPPHPLLLLATVESLDHTPSFEHFRGQIRGCVGIFIHMPQ